MCTRVPCLPTHALTCKLTSSTVCSAHDEGLSQVVLLKRMGYAWQATSGTGQTIALWYSLFGNVCLCAWVMLGQGHASGWRHAAWLSPYGDEAKSLLLAACTATHAELLQLEPHRCVLGSNTACVWFVLMTGLSDASELLAC